MKADIEIVIVEDDETIRTLLEMALLGAGYQHITKASRGDDGLTLIKRIKPDLVLLDLMLPGMDGIEVARNIREDGTLSATKILMLTARGQTGDIVRGLEGGADDYVVKPYDREVLLARVSAVLRRGLPLTEGVEIDGLRLDEPSRTLTYRGVPVEVTAGEFALLAKLVAHRGRIMRRDADERTVDVQVANLRRKLGKWGEHIETVRGIGYRVTP